MGAMRRYFCFCSRTTFPPCRTHSHFYHGNDIAEKPHLRIGTGHIAGVWRKKCSISTYSSKLIYFPSLTLELSTFLLDTLKVQVSHSVQWPSFVPISFTTAFLVLLDPNIDGSNSLKLPLNPNWILISWSPWKNISAGFNQFWGLQEAAIIHWAPFYFQRRITFPLLKLDFVKCIWLTCTTHDQLYLFSMFIHFTGCYVSPLHILTSWIYPGLESDSSEFCNNPCLTNHIKMNFVAFRTIFFLHVECSLLNAKEKFDNNKGILAAPFFCGPSSVIFSAREILSFFMNEISMAVWSSIFQPRVFIVLIPYGDLPLLILPIYSLLQEPSLVVSAYQTFYMFCFYADYLLKRCLNNQIYVNGSGKY